MKAKAEAVSPTRGSDSPLLTDPAPVLVWIYGGGFTAGSKTAKGNPAGLLARARDNNSSGIIYVALNYRLGLFVSMAISRNAHLADMRIGLALWTYISD
jgi:carboxylesterase type B